MKRETPQTLDDAFDFYEAGDFVAAVAACETILSADQDNYGALYLCGSIQGELGRYSESIALLRKAIRVNPQKAVAYMNLATVLLRSGSPGDALPVVDAYLAMAPKDALAHTTRASICMKLGMFADALSSGARAVELAPTFAEAHYNLGVALDRTDRLDDALRSYDRAIELKPDYADAYAKRTTTLNRLGRFEFALESASATLGAMTNAQTKFAGLREICMSLVALDAIPAIYRSEEELARVRRRVISDLAKVEASDFDFDGKNPSSAEAIGYTAFNSTGFYLAYQQENDVDLMRIVSRGLSRLLGVDSIAPAKRERRAGRMRVGIASEHLLSHNGAHWAYEWFAQLPKDYEFFTYAFHFVQDELAAKFAALGAHRSLDFGAKTYKRSLDVMREDDLDVLMLPDVGMTPSSRVLSLHRLAPVQFTAWGHPVTTGSPNVDFYLSSDLMEPEDAAGHYSETLLRMPNLALFLKPSPPIEHDGARFGLPSGRVCYGCLQSLYKYLPRYDRIFPRIAQEAPNALFVFLEGDPAYTTGIMRDRLARAFASAGLDAAKHVVFLPRVSPSQYRRLLSVMDVSIDTIGWSGGNTSIQAIEAGVPLVTLPGKFMRGRHTSAMLTRIGMQDLVAESIDDFVAKLVAFGRDGDRRAHSRSELLRNKDELYEDRRFIAAFDDFLKSTFKTSADSSD